MQQPSAEPLDTLTAETAYLFRHALLRDAAYEMQLPSDRAKLHELAFYLIEQAFGGRAPEPPALDAVDPPKLEPHATDLVAHELAHHARLGTRTAGPHTRAGETAALHGLYLRRAAEHADRQFRTESAVQCWQELAVRLAGAAQAEAWRRASIAWYSAGRPRLAEPLAQRALDTARKTGNRILEGITLGNLALVYDQTGRVDLAEQTTQQALAIHRENGNRRLQGFELGNLAGLYRESGRVAQAEETFLQALAIHREVGDRRAEGVALGNLAGIYRVTGRHTEAEQTFQQALAIHREVGNRRSVGIVLGNLANAYRESGRIERAELTYQQALAIHREVGNRRSEGITLGNLANVYRDAGRFEESERACQQALAIAREVGNRRFEGIHLCALGLLELERRPDMAHEVWRQGANILRGLNDTSQLERQTNAMHEACARAGVPSFEQPQDGSAE
ncbi:MAG: tetratricopeptide repeat protein [Planctomycetota bacterium]|nr:tetratricopeptide repeat protein [Planctomycetota bacterium]